MTTTRRWALLGAGGHAKVVIEAAQLSGLEIDVVLDDRPERAQFVGPVESPVTPERIAELGVTKGVIAIGSNTIRARIAGRFGADMCWQRVVHPQAIVSSNAIIDPGTVIFAGAIVQPGARIGAHVILNTACSVDHDCVVGDFAHLAPGVRLAGNVHVGEGAFLGIGSCVTPGVRIGRWATVGAGAAVINDVPDFATVVGVPARVIKIGAEPS